ncbi:LysR family transcriptional regulator [Rhodoplanes sp. Z2-YC6860]|uniref:LysR family transcriptional regulator n=1 Tax=Rhodoplanes sp. Z2-YC6860 TaxID=674703 RepID=UPI00078CEDD0|nr:LysR family transcriptional regulator [Rhodoplanes sp. Z2-YC6860]AMN39781.1 LysR family transcriptional regulator [Rhodoplanes sp. Z2-YC6860]
MIEKLEYLIALAQEKHFGRAAELCAVSQPSLSLGLKQLEESLGVLLVQRGSRFIGLTAEGERTLEWARRIVGDTRSMRQDISTLKRGLTGRLRIAVVPAALPMSARLTGPLAARHPGVQFTILSRPAHDIPPLLENLDIDAAVTYVDMARPNGFRAIPLYRERYQLLTTQDSSLALLETVTWEMVSRLQLCLLTPDTENRRIIEGLLRGTGENPCIMLESDSISVLFAHVRTGAWVSIVPDKIAQSTLVNESDLRAIPIVEPEAVHTVGLVMPERELTTPLATALATQARLTASELLH